MSGTPSILAIDEGTTGTTCLVLSEDGRVLGRAYSECTQHFPQPGWVEHDALEIWNVTQMVAREALAAAGVEASDLAAFVPHQANMRIIDEFAKQLGLPESVVIGRDIETTGNTSAASIPLATHRLLAEHPELSGGLALQIGFGAGLVYGAQVVVLP